jgi:glycosyltransferase involved in cell wall biosynthesis
MAAVPDLSSTLRQAPAPSSRLKVCLVTSFPPSRGDLNEYGFHLASALREHADVELLVLADETPVDEEPVDFSVERCWRFNSLLTPARLLTAIRKANPDVVWFNMGFSTFAREPLPAFLSIAGPALSRMSGFYTHVTLHTIFERINLRDAGVRMPRLYRTAGRVATHVLLRANDVTVLLPSYRSELLKKYRVHTERVHFRPHGTFSAGLPPNYTTETGTDAKAEKAVLAFGYWGTYKRLELVLNSWADINKDLPNAKLLIAGIDHPSTPGYLKSLQQRCGTNGNIRFLGYVPESDLPELFRAASLLVLPYSSAAGTSGVVHQACEYGLPMVAAGIPEIKELAHEYGVAAEFYSPEDGSALRTHIVRLLKSDEMRRRMAVQNLKAGKSMQMSQVVGGYLDLFKTRTRRRLHTKRHTIESQNPLAQAVGNWLLHSGIEEKNGGVARYHLWDEHRNTPVSTEITGYCASALVFLYQRTADARYLDSALKKARVLAENAWDASTSAMPFECEGNPRYSYFFDNGIIVRGLLAVWRKRPDSHVLSVAMKCGESMYHDFYDGRDFNPILSLPDKKPLPRERARWSRHSGCYQLKAALAWQELWQATADERYRTWYRNLLHSSLASHLSFLPGSENEDLVMDRLHAYSYFLEGLLPAISDPLCQEAMQVGIDRVQSYAEQISPQFLRSDVLAQILRVRIFADRAGVVPVNQEEATREAGLIRTFQSDDSDVRLNGGFWFGRKHGKLQPFMNPVSTVFCYQALDMWERFKQGSSDFYWQELI